MRGRIASWLVVVAFAVALGEIIWGAFGPPLLPDYFVGGNLTALANPDPDAKQLYLRQNIYLRERPRHAWLQVLAGDNLSVFVNGEPLATRTQVGFPVAIVEDPTPYLHSGKNVIAISTHQMSADLPPRVAVEGAYWLSDGEHPIKTSDDWRCSSVFERRAGWWFEHEFDDRQWAVPLRQRCCLQAKLPSPPRATIFRSEAKWITLSGAPQRSIAVRRAFTIREKPASGWLRVTSNACYRLAVNGVVVDRQEARLGTIERAPPVRRGYDITTFLHRGRNVAAMLAMSPTGTPAVLADFEVEDESGRRDSFGTDERWQGQSGAPDTWSEFNADETSRWQACHAESGDLGILPWEPPRAFIDLTLPLEVSLPRLAAQVAIIAALALIAGMLCRYVQLRLAAPAGEAKPRSPVFIAFLPLIPPTVAIAIAIIATGDPRVARQDVYQARWVAMALAAVAVQWGALMVMPRRWCLSSKEGLRRSLRFRAALAGLVFVGILAGGFWLRAQKMMAEQLQTDEAYQWSTAEGFRERGFPSKVLEAGQPIVYISTSEFVHCLVGITSFLTDSDCAMNRVPAVFWGTLTIFLLYATGRRMFGRDVGLMAAALAAFSPYCLDMSTWGRYPSQLHCTALLTVYCYWRTLENQERIHPRWLWLTAVSFVVMYLTWEASAFVALGMMLAALIQFRGRLRQIVFNRSIWLAMLFVLMSIVLQYSHREIQQAYRMYFGYGDQLITLTPMWRDRSFQILGYLGFTSWSCDPLLPAAGFLGAIIVCARHRFRKPARFVTVIYVTTCFSMSLLMPIYLKRYIFHMVPLLILLSAVALAAASRCLADLAVRQTRHYWFYAHGTVAMSAIALVIAGSGITLQHREGPPARYVLPPNGWRFRPFAEAMEYVCQQWQPGDLLLTDLPSGTGRYLRAIFSNPNDVTLNVKSVQKRPISPFTLSDKQLVPVHRMEGTIAVTNLESLKSVFARHGRIWAVVSPDLTSDSLNDAIIVEYMRENMEIVYEDFYALAMVRDRNNRPVLQQLRDERNLKRAKAQWWPPIQFN